MRYMRKYYSYRLWPIQLLEDLLKYAFADKQQKSIYKYVPCYCQECELLGICRNEQNKWKCRKGCMLMNDRKQ